MPLLQSGSRECESHQGYQTYHGHQYKLIDNPPTIVLICTVRTYILHIKKGPNNDYTDNGYKNK